MVISVDLTKDNEKKEWNGYKNICLAWKIEKYSKLLQKFIDKDYKFYKINGKKNDIKSFTCVKDDFSNKTYLPNTKVYNFLKEITDKFVFAKYYDEIGIFMGGETRYKHQKGFNMVKFIVKLNNNEYNVSMLEYVFKDLNPKINTKIPLTRTSNNNIRVDFKLVNDMLGISAGQFHKK